MESLPNQLQLRVLAYVGRPKTNVQRVFESFRLQCGNFRTYKVVGMTKRCDDDIHHYEGSNNNYRDVLAYWNLSFGHNHYQRVTLLQQIH